MRIERLEPRLCLTGAVEPAAADTASDCALVAFPGAEGFGRCAKGGRGGDVYHVENLFDDGPGSLREGLNSANGPRTIVFDVAGTIFLESNLGVYKPNITIAGETAPGDGITLAGDRFEVRNTHDVIVRYIRSRPGDILAETESPTTRDAFNVGNSTNVIFDHVSGSWASDEVFAFSGPGTVTFQWSIASEGLDETFHAEQHHSNGGLQIGGNLSMHHNLFVNNDVRNPRVAQTTDFVNNVAYNFGSAAIVGQLGGDDPEGPTNTNFEGNYYIAGPDTTRGTISLQRLVRFYEEAEIWTNDNYVDFNLNGIVDGYLATDDNLQFHDFDASPEGTVVDERFDYPRVTTTDAPTAFDQVVRGAGASLVRDSVDLRLVDEIMSQTGQIIDSQDEVGGWPDLKPGEPLPDSDRDGMPDAWEVLQDLNPQDPEDRNLDVDGNGYTELEEYLHALASGVRVQQLTATQAINNTNAPVGPAIPVVDQPLVDVELVHQWYPKRPSIVFQDPATASPNDATEPLNNGLRSIRRINERLPERTPISSDTTDTKAEDDRASREDRADIGRSVNGIARRANRLRRTAAHFQMPSK